MLWLFYPFTRSSGLGTAWANCSRNACYYPSSFSSPVMFVLDCGVGLFHPLRGFVLDLSLFLTSELKYEWCSS